MTDRKHIEGETDRILKLQHELTRIMSDAVDPEVGLQEALDRVVVASEMDAVWAWFRHGGEQDFSLDHKSGPVGGLVVALDPLPADSTVARLVLVREEAIGRWDDIWSDQAPAIGEQGWTFGAVVPIVSEGEVVGALGGGWRGGDGPGPGSECLWLLRNVANATGSLLGTIRRETEHRNTSANLTRLMDAVSDRMFIVAPDGSVLFHNRVSRAGSRDGNESLVGRQLAEILPGYADMRRAIHDGMEGPGGDHPAIPAQGHLVVSPDSTLPVEVVLDQGIWDDVQVDVVTCRDISGRLGLTREKEWLVTAINQVAESIVITDAHGEMIYVNPACCRMTGYSREELIGQNPRLLKSGLHDIEFYREMWTTLKRGDVWNGRVINRKRNGELFTEEATLSPVQDEDGNITHLVGVKRDVTAEIKLAERLRERQKMEAVGTLAGGIAHDFNNILYALLGYVDLALDDVPVGHPARKPLDEILAAGQRASNLVAKMLAFGRRSDGHREVVDLAQLVTEGLELARASLPSSIQIESDLAQSDYRVKADVPQIHQVLLGLCQNAAEAMDEGRGVLRVGLSYQALDPATARAFGEMKPGQWACLKITDNGRGIAPAILGRIFEPYFTTRSGAMGNGLGLATVHGIVSAHGGHIVAASEPGVGTEFTIYLPTRVVQRLSPPPEQVAGGDRRIASRIMIVDDEPMVTKVLERALNRFGYEVLVFNNGLTALEFFNADPDAVDVVITDRSMPGLSGFELASRMLTVKPELPLIMTTGYAESETQAIAADMGIRHFLGKPVQMNELKEILEALVMEPVLSQ